MVLCVVPVLCVFGSRWAYVLSPLVRAGSVCVVDSLCFLFLLSKSSLDNIHVLVCTVLCMLFVFVNVLVLAGPVYAVGSLFLLNLCVLVIPLTALFLLVLCVIVQLSVIMLTLIIHVTMYVLFLGPMCSCQFMCVSVYPCSSFVLLLIYVYCSRSSLFLFTMCILVVALHSYCSYVFLLTRIFRLDLDPLSL